jgi:integrase/recombinase XerD
LTAYRNDLAQAAVWFQGVGRAGWDEVSDADLAAFCSAIGSKVKPGTLRRRLSSLRSFFKFLHRRGVAVAARLPSAAGIRTPKRVPKALSIDTVDRLLSSPDLSRPTGLRDRALMELIYGAGLRVSEACSLTVAELSLDSASVRVNGKRGKSRWIPLPGQTVEWIDRYLAESRPLLARRPVAQALLADRGAPLSRSRAYRILEAHATKSGLGRVGPHVLRHSYAVHLVQGGADLRAVQELLGHASISTTQVYTQLDLESVRKRYGAAHPRK